MRERFSCTFAMLITLAACSGKHRPFADSQIEGLGGSSGGAATTTETGNSGSSSAPGLEPAATEGGPAADVPDDELSAPDDAVQDSGDLACVSDAGACKSADAGRAPSACTATGPRDCTSEADNDCDGQPDNIIDAVCGCISGTSEACDEHPGLDGQGQCRAGVRTCLLNENALTTDWGECDGAVGPGDVDSCEPGDDTDCDGTPNEGCSCVDGQTQPCGSNTNTGPCQIGTSTCVGGRFGECVGAVAPASGDSCASRDDDANCNGIPFDSCSCVNGETQSCGVTDTGVCQFGTRTCSNGAFGQCVGASGPFARDCRSPQDNDCDGRPDNAIDNVCQCVIGTTQACGTHPEDGVGSCRAGSQQCQAGPNNSSSSLGGCTGSVGPAPQDSCAADGNDDNCNNFPNDGCGCIAGQGNAPCRDDPNNSRCNAQGQCAPCDSDADCALVSGARQLCGTGQCAASSVIAAWTITGAIGSSLPSTSAASGVTGLTMTQASAFEAGPALQNTFAPTDWPRNDETIDLDKYLEFGVMLNAGANATYERLEFAVSCQFCENASANWQIRSSVDSFASVVADGSLASVVPPALLAPNIRSIGTRGGTVRFRFYMFNVEAPAGVGSGQASPIVGFRGGAQGASLSIFAGLL